MNNTEAVRYYCKKNQGTILDTAYVHDNFFPAVEERTFFKILKRLEKEGILSSVSKGVYYIGDAEKTDIDQKIREFYIGELDGIVVGDELYRKLGISDSKDKFVYAYTNKLPNGKGKNVRDFRFMGAELDFTEEVKRLISLLEIIEKKNNIAHLDIVKYDEAKTRLATFYSDAAFVLIIEALPYSPGIIAVLAERLETLGKRNKVMELYKRAKTAKEA